MILTIKPTPEFQQIEGQPHRVWEGTTDKGVPVHVYVRAVEARTHDEAELKVFELELRALPPAQKQVVITDLRFIL